jgi:hypothetical protein
MRDERHRRCVDCQHVMRTVGWALFLSIVFVPSIHAQDSPLIPLGVRVRVRESAPGGQTTFGTLVGVTRDSITLSPRELNDERAFALASLSEVAVSRGRHSRTGRGALIGLITGTVAGVASGLILCSHEDCESSGGDFAGLATATLGLGGALVGTGLGALIGSFVRTERWENIPLGLFTLRGGPASGVRMVVSLPFPGVLTGRRSSPAPY